MKIPKSLPSPSALAIATLLAPITATMAFAADGTWTLDGNANWSDTTRWNGGIVADGSGFTANFTNNITADRTVTLNSARTIGNIVFGDATPSSAGSWIISGANTLTLAGGTPTITVNTLGTNKTATISSIIDGTSGLTKAGVGTLILTGANIYSGNTTISAGTLQVGDTTTSATLNGTYNLAASGATLKVQYNATGVDRDLVTAGIQGWDATTWSKFTGNGTLVLATAKTNDSGWGTAALGAGFAGTLQIDGGRVFTSTTAPAYGLGGTTNIVVNSGGQMGMWDGGTFNQNITLSGTGYGEAGFDAALRLANTGVTVNLGGIITLSNNATIGARNGATGGNNFNNTIQGTGALTLGTSSLNSGIYTFKGTNTYSGATTLNNGTLILDYTTNNTNKVSSTAALTLAPGATLQFTGNAAADTAQNIKGLTLSGVGVSTISAVTQTGRTLTADFTANSGTLTRTNGTLDLLVSGGGTAQVKLGVAANTAVIPWATYNTNVFAGTDASGYLKAASTANTTATDLSTWATGLTHYTTTGAAFTGNVGTGVTIDGVTFKDAAARTVAIGAGNTLTLNQGIIVTAGVGNNASTISGGSIRGSASGALNVLNNDISNNLSIGSSIVDNTGATSLTKSGAGVLILNGAAANTYTGSTTIFGGQLGLAKTGGAVAIATDMLMSGIGTGGGRSILWTSQNNQFGANTVLRFSGAGDNRLELNGTTQTFAGLDSSGFTGGGFSGAFIQHREFTSGATAVDATSDLIINVAEGNSFTYGNNGATLRSYTGGTVAVTKNGAGTQTFTGAGISYTGATTLSGGTLALKDTTAFASAIGLSGSSILSSERTALGFGNRSAILGGNVSGTGTLNINNSGTGTAGGWTAVGVANGLTMGGVINVNSGVLTRDGVTANNINTTATVNVDANGVLGTRGGGVIIGALNGAGHVSPLWANASATTLTLGNGDGGGAFSGIIHGNGSSSTDGNIEGGTLALVKIGTGTQVLSGNNTYTGTTTISGGTLKLDGAGAINTSSQIRVGDTAGSTAQLDVTTKTGGFTVGAAQTLKGAGSILGNVNVSGVLAPGNSIESITVTGDLTMNAGSTFQFEAADNGATGADLLGVNGALSLNGVTLDLTAANLNGSWVSGDKLTLISYTGNAITGGFTGYTDDTEYAFGSNNWRIDYNDTTKGNNFATDATGTKFVTLTMVPEPSVALLGGFGALALLRRRRLSK